MARQGFTFELGRGSSGGGGSSYYINNYKREDPTEVAEKEARAKAQILENQHTRLVLESQESAIKSLNKIGALDPSNMDFEHDYEKIMGDADLHLARIGPGKSAVENELARKLEQHKDHIDTWNKIASNYYYQGDIRRLPVDKNNRIDWEATLPIFQNAQAQHYARVQQAMEENAPKLAEAGYAQVEAVDPETGKTKSFLKKFPSVKKDVWEQTGTPSATPSQMKTSPAATQKALTFDEVQSGASQENDPFAGINFGT